MTNQQIKKSSTWTPDILISDNIKVQFELSNQRFWERLIYGTNPSLHQYRFCKFGILNIKLNLNEMHAIFPN